MICERRSKRRALSESEGRYEMHAPQHVPTSSTDALAIAPLGRAMGYPFKSSPVKYELISIINEFKVCEV